MTLDSDQVAELFAVSARTVRRWVARGMPAGGDPAVRSFDARACIAWRLDDERRRVLETTDSPSDAWKAARARKEEALADRHEIEARERAAQLVEKEPAHALFQSEVELLRSALIEWPANVAPDMAADLNVDPDDLEAALAPRIAGVVARTEMFTTETK